MSSLPPPLTEYPHTLSATQPSSRSRGSFGPVFIALAIIAVLATVACVVGRLCSRRLCRPKDHPVCTHAGGDVEDRFETSVPTAKPAGKQGAKGAAKPAAGRSGGGGLKGSASIHADIRGTKVDANQGGANGNGKAKFMTGV